jgi:hypothetical protein
MVLVIYSKWSPADSDEVIKRMPTLPPIPDYIERKLLYRTVAGEGNVAFDIYEFDDYRYKEAHAYLQSRALCFYGIPSFTFSVDRWVTETEVAGLISMIKEDNSWWSREVRK